MPRRELSTKSECCKAAIVEYKGMMGQFPVKHYTCSKCGERVQSDGKKWKRP